MSAADPVLQILRDFFETHLGADAGVEDDTVYVNAGVWVGRAGVIARNHGTSGLHMVGLEFEVRLLDRPGPRLIDTAVGLESSPEAATLAAAHAWLAGMHAVIEQLLSGTAPQFTWGGSDGNWMVHGSSLSVRATPEDAEAVGIILTDTSFVQALEEAAQASLTPGEAYWIKVTHTLNALEQIIDVHLNGEPWSAGLACIEAITLPPLTGPLRVLRWCGYATPLA